MSIGMPCLRGDAWMDPDCYGAHAGEDGVMVRPGRVSAACRRLAAIVIVLASATALVPAGAAAQDATQDQQVYFDRTRQTLANPFFDGWTEQGGLAEIGAPVSQAVQKGEQWTQWFEYTRLEVNKPTLDGATAADVQPAALGLQLAEEIGLTRWHPAFRQFQGQAAPEVRVFENGHTLANAFKQTYEDQDTGARLGTPISEEFRIGETAYQFFERGALSWNPDFGVDFVPLGYYDAAMNGDLRLTGEQPEGVASYGAATNDTATPALSGATGERWIDVNLSTYTLTAYSGNTPQLQTVIVDGAPATPTATGTFYIHSKYDTQTMRGRNTDGSEYVTEDVPYVMYFYADFALHGAYWRSSFGYSGSHGCVNMPVGDAAWLYNWAGYGTRVVVHY
jgi:hypothetical protein